MATTQPVSEKGDTREVATATPRRHWRGALRSVTRLCGSKCTPSRLPHAMGSPPSPYPSDVRFFYFRKRRQNNFGAPHRTFLLLTFFYMGHSTSRLILTAAMGHTRRLGAEHVSFHHHSLAKKPAPATYERHCFARFCPSQSEIASAHRTNFLKKKKETNGPGHNLPPLSKDGIPT